jgi:peptidoglycan/xylan/chitin deacetylase (PgdA/CDA1 family)
MKRFVERVLNHACALRPEKRENKIIYFHSVMAGVPRSHSPGQFESYLKYLMDLGYGGVSVSQLITGSHPSSQNVVAITFDDGYHDNLTVAAPLMLKYGFCGTIYMVTNMIGAGERKCSNQGHRLYPDRKMLSAADLRELDALGFEIGSHTCTHPLLSQVYKRSPEAAKWEVESSKHCLEDILGKEVSAFAYPNGQKGAFSRQTVELVENAGYTSGVTTLWGSYDEHSSPFVLERCEISIRDDIKGFGQKINGQQDYRSALHKIFDGSKNWR